MALLNKLFPRLKTTPQNSHEDIVVSNNLSAFTTDQVRVVLFRECDFRGRKLLFDSEATQKISLEKAEQDKKFVEVNNGFGYLVIAKPNGDYSQLSEIIFGSVAMSFRGTYFKIHSLNFPSRLMFTQVFPSPHIKRLKTSSVCSHQSQTSGHSFDNSFKLVDSGASSPFSTSEQLSDRSTASDTVLVCHRRQSIPLDVPAVVSSFSKNSLVVDSGFADQSFSSLSTGPVPFSTWESVFSYRGLSFSSCSVFKRLLRSSTRSLKNSSISLPNSTEVLHKHHHKASKLGLSIIVEILPEKEEFLTQFFMEHIALVEALIWRTRQAVEIAYHQPSTFISLMVDIAQNTASWLVNLLNAPKIFTNLWHCLSINCDNYTSINAFVSELDSKSVDLSRTRSYSVCLRNGLSDNKLSFTNSFSGVPFLKHERTEIFSFNFSKFLKTDDTSKMSGFGDDYTVEKFLKEFCELLEASDVKNTNFFISTLLTAVLTHHLGWVATCLPYSIDKEVICSLKQPYNALWSQMTDLYGAVGHPVKTAQTVVTGSNKNNISKILTSLTYFIRFGNVERKNVQRCSVDIENKSAEIICSKNNCIPKEYYKRYEDHLKEMSSNGFSKPGCSKVLKENVQTILKDFGGISRTKANANLFALNDEISDKCNRSEVLPVGQVLSKNKTNGDLFQLNEDGRQEFSIPQVLSNLRNGFSNSGLGKIASSMDLTRMGKESSIEELKNGCDINENTLEKSSTVKDLAKLNTKTELEKQRSCDLNQNLLQASCDKSSVIFVLGDDEKLIGIKKDEYINDKPDPTVISGAKRKVSSGNRPTTLSLSKTTYNFSKNLIELAKPECNENESCLKTTSSYESLCITSKIYEETTHSNLEPKNNIRAQSEPPENNKPKYQYSRVKFNLQQYPQVVRNYMKSKNIELEGLSLGEKAFDKFATIQHNIKLDLSGYESDPEEVEALQTPSNASELEFTSDLHSEAVREDSRKASIARMKDQKSSRVMKIVNIPMPKTRIGESSEYSISYTSTVMKGLVDTYIPDMVLQGTTNPKKLWDSKLKSNLAMNTQHSLLDQPVEESLAIVANTDTWEVQVMSSHTYVIDKGSTGVRVGMSQMVANMLESLLHMWKLHIPPQYCILHIEQRLQELCVRSKALAQMLLASEFCSMEQLTSTLRVEVNDVPLLMAVASTHTPEVTRKYGLSFQ